MVLIEKTLLVGPIDQEPTEVSVSAAVRERRVDVVVRLPFEYGQVSLRLYPSQARALAEALLDAALDAEDH